MRLPEPARRGELASRVLMSAATLWLAVSFVDAVSGALRPYLADEFSYHAAWKWRFGSAPVAELERFLDAARARIPPGEVVVFSSRQSPGQGNFLRYMWASYLLPHLHVRPPPRRLGPRTASYWIAYRKAEDRPELELLWRDQEGHLYRIRPRPRPETGPPP